MPAIQPVLLAAACLAMLPARSWAFYTTDDLRAAGRNYIVYVADFLGDKNATVGRFEPTWTQAVQDVWSTLGVQNHSFDVRAEPLRTVIPTTASENADFVLPNPLFVAEMVQEHGYRIVASMENMRLGQAVSEFGGVVLTHADNTHISEPLDCVAASPMDVAVVSFKSFGGYVVQMKMLLDMGFPASRLSDRGFVPMGNQPAVVDAVNSGNVTCGFIRTDLYEGFQQTDPARVANIRIVSPRTDPTGALFPFAVTTPLYPEWSVIAAPHVPDVAIELMRTALLTIRAQHAAAAQGQYSRWFPPVSHAAVYEAIWALGIVPRPSSGTVESSSLGRVLGAVVGSVSALAAAVVAMLLLRHRASGRDLSQAPQDEAKPFSIVFTDIQASTALWAADPEGMGPSTDMHHAIVRELLKKHRGYEVKTIGDSFMVAFVEAHDAVNFAMDVQRSMFGADFAPFVDELYKRDMLERSAEIGARYSAVTDPALAEHAVRGTSAVAAVEQQHIDRGLYERYWRGLRVRIGIHTGHGEIKLDPTTNAYDYYGTVVNTASRIEAAAHGGQVLVSASVVEALQEDDLKEIDAKPLGARELAGLSDRVELHQLLPSRFAGRCFFPPRSLDEIAISGDIARNAAQLAVNESTSIDDSDSHHRSLNSSASSDHRQQAYVLDDASDNLAAHLVQHDPAGRAQLVYVFAALERALAPMPPSDRRSVLAKIAASWRVDVPAKGVREKVEARRATMMIAHRVMAALKHAGLSLSDPHTLGNSNADGSSRDLRTLKSSDYSPANPHHAPSHASPGQAPTAGLPGSLVLCNI